MFWMVHCGIWDRCVDLWDWSIVYFVMLSCPAQKFDQLIDPWEMWKWFWNVIFKVISHIDILNNIYEIALKRQNLLDDESTMIRVMTWCSCTEEEYRGSCCESTCKSHVCLACWCPGDCSHQGIRRLDIEFSTFAYEYMTWMRWIPSKKKHLLRFLRLCCTGWYLRQLLKAGAKNPKCHSLAFHDRFRCHITQGNI